MCEFFGFVCILEGGFKGLCPMQLTHCLFPTAIAYLPRRLALAGLLPTNESASHRAEPVPLPVLGLSSPALQYFFIRTFQQAPLLYQRSIQVLPHDRPVLTTCTNWQNLFSPVKRATLVCLLLNRCIPFGWPLSLRVLPSVSTPLPPLLRLLPCSAVLIATLTRLW